jgi:pimeloyl-ACP methyl ester carboxylesterase
VPDCTAICEIQRHSKQACKNEKATSILKYRGKQSLYFNNSFAHFVLAIRAGLHPRLKHFLGIVNMMSKWILAAALIGAACFTGSKSVEAKVAFAKPTTIILVHGAFAGSSSWNGVITNLVADGYPVIAVANPLRGLKSDADYVARVVESVPGPVVLVGHSYGGEVITVAGVGKGNVKALVYVAGLAPDVGESAASLGERFPGGTLGQALAPSIAQADGGEDLYIRQDKYWKQFAADVPEDAARQMAATQRPVTKGALGEPSAASAWKTLPSWFIYGSLDKNIPPTLHAFMAKRANGKEAIEVKGASHVVMISHAREVAQLIDRAASAK